MTRARGLGLACLAALPVVAADLAIKGLVVRALAPGGSRVVLLPDLLELIYSENRAAAFGLLRTLPPAAFPVLISIVLVIFLVLAWPFLQRATGVVLTALVLGGAIGNLVDRLRTHYVIDYIYFHVGTRFSWPVFNFADTCVVIGIGLLVLLLLRSEHARARAAATTPAPEETNV
jgi:signal peptidase II